ncbi:TerD family protein [Streptomyces sp. NPDC052396]|uniref:TerD family protein n=1 Tax=Streptomyces sp. NPDC052396 TaxID=3365689 RepID=UPI0037CDA858
MTAELVRGQNHPLSETRLEVRITAGHPVAVAVTLGGADGTIAGPRGVVCAGSPSVPGAEVPVRPSVNHRLALDLGELPERVHRVSVLLVLPAGGPACFGATAAPYLAVGGLTDEGLADGRTVGEAVADFTITGLGAETALTALEIYRRQGGWRVRAVGQGYAGGLPELLRDHGLAAADALAAERLAGCGRDMAEGAWPSPVAGSDPGQDPGPDPASGPDPGFGPDLGSGPAGAPEVPTPPVPPRTSAPPERPPMPVAGDATGWTLDERLYNQVWGMFEDLARTAAAYRSAVGFAESRLEQELDRVLGDPRTRVGPAAEAARAEARARHTGLTGRARAVLDRDLAQLSVEAEVVERALPPAYARWDSPVWQGYRPPKRPPLAVRLGELHLPERPELRIPMLVRLPLERGLWVDCGRMAAADPVELRRLALECALAHAVRLLAVHPVGDFAVWVIDPAGAAEAAFAPLRESGVLPATGAQGVAEVLERLTRRVELVQMAVRGGAVDALPPDLDTGEQLLVVHDFPHGFDDRAVTRLRYLADEGPSVGVHLMMVADRAEAGAFGPVLDPLWRTLLRVTPVPDDHLADPWVGHAWTYEPALTPGGGEVLRRTLRQIGGAGQQNGH